MRDTPTGIERELTMLEAEIKRLETEYNQYFGGRLPRPPWETRKRVETLVKHLDRMHLSNYGERFRLATLQTRVMTFTDLWDRALRAREEGRPGPLGQPRAPEPVTPQAGEDDRIKHVAVFRDPLREMDKLHDLYDSVAEARREAGQDAIPFHRFAELIKTQVTAMRDQGSPEVAFRVAVKEGKVVFTARGLKGLS